MKLFHLTKLRRVTSCNVSMLVIPSGSASCDSSGQEENSNDMFIDGTKCGYSCGDDFGKPGWRQHRLEWQSGEKVEGPWYAQCINGTWDMARWVGKEGNTVQACIEGELLST